MLMHWDERKAIMIEDKRITDFIYDEVRTSGDTIFGIIRQDEKSTIHAFNSKTGEIVFKKDNVTCFKEMRKNAFELELITGQKYIYFSGFFTRLRGPFSEVSSDAGIVIVKRKTGYGAYNACGRVLVPCVYDNIEIVCFASAIEVTKGDKVSLIDYSGRTLVGPITGRLGYYNSCGMVRVESTSNWTQGLYDYMNRKVILPNIFDIVEIDSHNDLIYVCKDGLWAMLTINGYWLTPFKFNRIDSRRGYAELYSSYYRLNLIYIPQEDLIVTPNCFKARKNKIKYFDGRRWRTIKYSKE